MLSPSIATLFSMCVPGWVGVGVGAGDGVGVGVGVGVGTGVDAGVSAGGLASAVDPPEILQPPKRMHSAKGAIFITRIVSLPAPRLDEFQLYF